AVLAQHALAYLGTGENPGRIGNSSQTVSPYDVYQTADRPIIIATGNEAQFRRLCDVLDASRLASDPRFASNALRVANRIALKQEPAAEGGGRAPVFWCERRAAPGARVARINRWGVAWVHPKPPPRGRRVRVPHAPWGTFPPLPSPFRIDGAPAVSLRAPP